MVSSEKSLNFHAITFSLVAGVLKYLKNSWNTKTFCVPSSPKRLLKGNNLNQKFEKNISAMDNMYKQGNFSMI